MDQKQNDEYFYPRPRVEGDRVAANNIYRQNDFYPRPRVEGDPLSPPPLIFALNFYPRPRVEGDPIAKMIEQELTISTHALA